MMWNAIPLQVGRAGPFAGFGGESVYSKGILAN